MKVHPSSSRGPFGRSLAIVATGVPLVLGLPDRAPAQAIGTSTRLLIGEHALEVRPSGNETVRLALADSTKVVVLTVLARDARRWLDSLNILIRARPRSKRVPQEWRATLEEPGLQAGSISITRRHGETGSSWSLFVSDREFEQVRTALLVADVHALIGAVRRSVAASLPPPRRKRPGAQRPPDESRRRN